MAIDEGKVNAKLKWKDGKLVIVAMVDIAPGDEIYLHYGLEYWRDRLHLLDPDLKARIEDRCKRKAVQFQDDVTVIFFKSQGRVRDGKVDPEGGHLHRAAPNLETRTRDFEAVEEEPEDEDDREEVEKRIAEELAEEVAKVLNRRKSTDNENGKLYEIYQVRFDDEFEQVIGFRKPLSGREKKDDACAYAVYGKDGL